MQQIPAAVTENTAAAVGAVAAAAAAAVGVRGDDG